MTSTPGNDLLSAAVLASLAVPAGALADTGDTTATFSLAAGALTITVPAAAALGPATAVDSVSGQLGVVTVSDSP